MFYIHFFKTTFFKCLVYLFIPMWGWGSPIVWYLEILLFILCTFLLFTVNMLYEYFLYLFFTKWDRDSLIFPFVYTLSILNTFIPNHGYINIQFFLFSLLYEVGISLFLFILIIFIPNHGYINIQYCGISKWYTNE